MGLDRIENFRKLDQDLPNHLDEECGACCQGSDHVLVTELGLFE